MKRKAIFFLIFIGILILLNYLFLPKKDKAEKLITPRHIPETTIWEYQCIDTMKISRDKARAWANYPDLDSHINWEMQSIAGMGGNCVAIDTPYDEEFLPIMKKWVNAARAHNLKIWFRGNFSSWEGWFEYPKGMTVEEHNQKTFAFITGNPDLFLDGDIFTPSPEAENGGPFNQVEKDEHPAFRAYLISEYENAKKAFEQINKKVHLNWLSMNGGFAKRMFDQPTIDKLDKVVSLDHYIKTAPEMDEYINYFHETFGAKVVLGEFGAPIPDINGVMTEKQQAEFIDELLFELYKNKNKVIGLNYWTLYDGSTALFNPDKSPRDAVKVMQNYFIPIQISGTIVNDLGEPVENAKIQTEDGISESISDKNGNFNLLIPSKKTTLNINHTNLSPETQTITPNNERKINLKITLFQNNPVLFYQLKRIYFKYLKLF